MHVCACKVCMEMQVKYAYICALYICAYISMCTYISVHMRVCVLNNVRVHNCMNQIATSTHILLSEYPYSHMYMHVPISVCSLYILMLMCINHLGWESLVRIWTYFFMLKWQLIIKQATAHVSQAKPLHTIQVSQMCDRLCFAKGSNCSISKSRGLCRSLNRQADLQGRWCTCICESLVVNMGTFLSPRQWIASSTRRETEIPVYSVSSFPIFIFKMDIEALIVCCGWLNIPPNPE